MPSTEDALALKKKGNEAVASHDWLKAVEFYSQAIDVNDKDATFYCNRAQVSLTMSYCSRLFLALVTDLASDYRRT